MKRMPPKLFHLFFQWYCRPKLKDFIEGDLMEVYNERVKGLGKRKADIQFMIDVMLLFRPGIVKPFRGNKNLNTYGMYRSYFKIGWRNLLRTKGYSFINISGLALGMSIAILVGLWIWDELSFNRYNLAYENIAQIARKERANGEIYIAENSNHFPIPLADELRTNYGNFFQRVALASPRIEQIVSFDKEKFSRQGMYVEPDFVEIFTLHFKKGSGVKFGEPNTILIKESLACSLFNDSDPIGKILQLNSTQSVTVTGVFEDLPRNTRFSDVSFFCPFSLLVNSNNNVKNNLNNWGDSSFEIFVQTPPGVSMENVSDRIKNVYWSKIESTRPKIAGYELSVFLHPMKDWHLRSEWNNGVQAGGRIQQVWLFGMIGTFVLLLACINFMNLSTARSEKRAKEVGVRKTIGSVQSQLVKQFLSESLLVVCIAFTVSLGLVSLSMDWFNQLADKEISLPFTKPEFWILSLTFILITATVSGSYPALYLSSFQPVKVLKGTFRSGNLAVIPRKVLVALQFTISIMLMIGTTVVYQQIQYAQNRPVGYVRDGLIRITMNTPDLYGKYDILQKELIESGGAIGFAQSSSGTTQNNYFADNFEWDGKDPNVHQMSFALVGITYEYGETIGWQFAAGRDFSKKFATDSSGIILNEAAVKYMGLQDPIGATVKRNNTPYTIIGVVKDLITESPYEPVKQSIYFLVPGIGPFITIRLNPRLSARDALAKIEPIFKKYNPSDSFDYNFIDEEYGRKFSAEQRIGTLASFFSSFAIFISCLGIFGLASFVVEQRTKEIGVRKILGASILNMWGLLSKEFVALVVIAFVVAAPAAYYFMDQWLQKYEYRTDISWWIFLIVGMVAVIITILTVSYQTIKAALMNPVKSLKSE